MDFFHIFFYLPSSKEIAYGLGFCDFDLLRMDGFFLVDGFQLGGRITLLAVSADFTVILILGGLRLVGFFDPALADGLTADFTVGLVFDCEFGLAETFGERVVETFVVGLAAPFADDLDVGFTAFCVFFAGVLLGFGVALLDGGLIFLPVEVGLVLFI